MKSKKKFHPKKDTCEDPYISNPHWVREGCNHLGQCTEYFSGPHAVKQVLAKFGIYKYDEYTLAEYAGTTPDKGTSQYGIEAVFKTVGSKEGINFSIFWQNFILLVTIMLKDLNILEN